MTVPALPQAFIRHRAASQLLAECTEIAHESGVHLSAVLESTASAAELLPVYRVRMHSLAEAPTPFGASLHHDLAQLVDAMAQCSAGTQVLISSATLSNALCVVTFEDAESLTLLGLLRSADDRMMSPNHRRELWGRA